MNNHIPKETKPVSKNPHQEQMNAIAKAMIVSFAWSLTDLLAENKPTNEQTKGK